MPMNLPAACSRLSGALIALMLAGCGTVTHHGGQPSIAVTRLLLPPFVNATDNEHAGRALTEMTGSALVEAGLPLFQTEETLLKSAADKAQGPDGRYAELARTVSASHLLIGTVHEYRYKTDLNGDPAVGITLRLVDAATGQTLWQGTSGNVGYAFASVTSASARAVGSLVRQLPVVGNRLRRTPGAR
jgi:polysaccharide biosynthesis protein PelC